MLAVKAPGVVRSCWEDITGGITVELDLEREVVRGERRVITEHVQAVHQVVARSQREVNGAAALVSWNGRRELFRHNAQLKSIARGSQPRPGGILRRG